MNNIEIMISKGIDKDIAVYLDTCAPEGFPNMYPHFVNLKINQENYRFMANQLINFVQKGLTE